MIDKIRLACTLHTQRNEMNYYVIALIALGILLFIKLLVALWIYFSRQEERVQQRTRQPRRRCNQLTRVYIVPQQQQIPAHTMYRPPACPIYHYNVPIVNQNLAYVKDEPPSYFEATQQNRLQ